MSTFVQKSEATQQTVSAKAPVPGWANFGQSPEVSWILHLQRTIGNQAVQRLLEANARDVNGNSTPEIARFGHDLSRMPAHAATPVEVQLRPSLRKGDEEPNLAPVTQEVTVPAPSQIAPKEPALMQRRLAEAIDKSPRMMQPRALMDGIDNSARVLQQKTFAGSISSSPLNVEQHEQRESFFGGAVQRKREEELKGKFAQRAKGKEEEEEPLQRKVALGPPAQLQEPSPKFNGTGLPDQLKSAIESLSGMSLDDVNVHYNSARPAQLNALAYVRGSDIHVAPGQEQHLPHEAWHVVQQAQGRVQPTMQLQDGVPVNDDEGLEQEADAMGEKALVVGHLAVPSRPFQGRTGPAQNHPPRERDNGQFEEGPLTFLSLTPSGGIVQRVFEADGEVVRFDPEKSDVDKQGEEGWRCIEIDNIKVWTQSQNKEDDEKIKRQYSKSELEKMASLARMEYFEKKAEAEETESYSSAEYHELISQKTLGLDEQEMQFGKQGINAKGNDVYKEFAHSRGSLNERGYTNIRFKTGFTRDLGIAIIRDAFREGDKIGKEFFASDVFLVHLKQATDSWSEGDAGVLPTFPREIYIPQLLNKKTCDVAEGILKELGMGGAKGALIGAKDKDWQAILVTPLLQIVSRSIDGYNHINK